VWNTESRQAVLDAGIAAVTFYTTGNQDELNAMLGWNVEIICQPADIEIATYDPARPAAPVPHVLSENSPLTTVVLVPTSGGEYRVSVTRYDGASPWLVQNIIGPGQ
jgi:hypothetical protein